MENPFKKFGATFLHYSTLINFNLGRSKHSQKSKFSRYSKGSEKDKTNNHLLEENKKNGREKRVVLNSARKEEKKLYTTDEKPFIIKTNKMKPENRKSKTHTFNNLNQVIPPKSKIIPIPSKLMSNKIDKINSNLNYNSDTNRSYRKDLDESERSIGSEVLTKEIPSRNKETIIQFQELNEERQRKEHKISKDLEEVFDVPSFDSKDQKSQSILNKNLQQNMEFLEKFKTHIHLEKRSY